MHLENFIIKDLTVSTADGMSFNEAVNATPWSIGFVVSVGSGGNSQKPPNDPTPNGDYYSPNSYGPKTDENGNIAVTASLNGGYYEEGDDGDDSPYFNTHGLNVYSMAQFWRANFGKSYHEIITQAPKKDGLPGGPKMRMVRDPRDGRIMDMRHVMVVGFGGGNIIGLGVEVGQWLGPYYGKPRARESAYDMQDFYSNNIGAAFFTNSLLNGNLGQDWSSAFYLWIHTK